MNFERGRDVKAAMGLGIADQLPKMMEDSDKDVNDYYDVWQWGIEEKQDFVFQYIVSMNGKKWFNGDIVEIGMADNNGLLWVSVSEMYLPAIQALLTIPGLFLPEVLNMKYGTSPLEETFMRGNRKIPFRGTNFGAFYHLAMVQAHGNFEIQDTLNEYYKKEKNDKVRKRTNRS